MKLKILKFMTCSCHVHATSEKFMKLSKSMNFVHDLQTLNAIHITIWGVHMLYIAYYHL